MVSDINPCCNSDSLCQIPSPSTASLTSSASASPQAHFMLPNDTAFPGGAYPVDYSQASLPSPTCDGCYCQYDDDDNKDDVALDVHFSDAHCLHASPSSSSDSPPLPRSEFSPTFYNPFETKHRRRTSRVQHRILEQAFQDNPKPSSAIRQELAEQLAMTPRSVQIWFQNRRAKAKQQQSAGKDESTGKRVEGSAGVGDDACPRPTKRRRAVSRPMGRPLCKPLFTEWNSHDPLPDSSVTELATLARSEAPLEKSSSAAADMAPISKGSASYDDGNMKMHYFHEPATPQQPVIIGDPEALGLNFITGYDLMVLDNQIFTDLKTMPIHTPFNLIDPNIDSTDATPALDFDSLGLTAVDVWATGTAGMGDPCPLLIGSAPDMGAFRDDAADVIQTLSQDVQPGAIYADLPAQNPHHYRRHSDPEEYLCTLGVFGWNEPLPPQCDTQSQSPLSRNFPDSLYDFDFLSAV